MPRAGGRAERDPHLRPGVPQRGPLSSPSAIRDGDSAAGSLEEITHPTPWVLCASGQTGSATPSIAQHELGQQQAHSGAVVSQPEHVPLPPHHGQVSTGGQGWGSDKRGGRGGREQSGQLEGVPALPQPRTKPTAPQVLTWFVIAGTQLRPAPPTLAYTSQQPQAGRTGATFSSRHH